MSQAAEQDLVSRKQIVEAYQQTDLSDEEFAKSINVQPRQLSNLLNKHLEISLAEAFYDRIHVKYDDILTLAEFHKFAKHPKSHRLLDEVCPDAVVVASNGPPFGVEITAYTDQSIELENNWHSTIQQLSHVVRESLASEFPGLRGYRIFYHPDASIRPKFSYVQVARLILETALQFVTRSKPAADEFIDIPITPPSCRFRTDPPLRQAGIRSMHIAFFSGLRNAPVALELSGIPSFIGLSTESLIQIVEGKSSKISTGYWEGLPSSDLLIHGVGVPRGSRISPTQHYKFDCPDAERLERIVVNSAFNRIFVWDGRFGGALELRSKARIPCEPWPSEIKPVTSTSESTSVE